jgi:solute carrier family 25 (mitochondrial adenine nucleotide translocator), member 4/5/6/31
MGDSSSIELNFLKDLLIGGVSSGVSKTISAPVDRVKLLLQLQDASPKIMEGKKYTGIIDCLTRVKREQGFYSFWRGNLPSVLRYFPNQVLNFAFKDFFKTNFNPYNPKNDPLKFFLGNMVSGGAAGACSLAVTYPFDFARTRLAMDVGKGVNREFEGFIDCLTKVTKTDSVYGLYRGYGITVSGIVIYRALYFGMFDTGRQVLFNPTEKPSTFVLWIFAQAVTLTSAIATYPFDTVRRRLMMQSGRNDILYSSTLDCFRKMYRKEGGIRSFYKGFSVSLLQAVGGSLTLMAYNLL